MDHEHGCYRCHIARFLEDGTVHLTPTYKRRWSCPQCSLDKFVEKVEHLFTLDVLSMILTEHPSHYTELARDAEEGHVTIYLSSRHALVISTPKVLPEGTILESYELLVKAFKIATTDGITRMVVADKWKVEKETVEQLVCTIRVNNPREVLADSGFTPMSAHTYQTNQPTAQDAVEVFLEAQEMEENGVNPIL